MAELPRSNTTTSRASAQLVHSELEDEPVDESVLKHPLRRMRSSFMFGQDLKIDKASEKDTTN